MPQYKFLPGYLVFFWGQEIKSQVIEWATRGPSHVGIVTSWDDPHDRDAVLCESTTLCDQADLVTGRKIDGVQIHDVSRRINAYPGRVSVMRPTAVRLLDPDEADALRDWLVELHGKPYDLRGALTSATRLFKWLPWVPYPDLGHLFCSELCAEMLMCLGRLPLWDPAVYNPASLMRTLLRCASYNPPQRLK